MYLYIYADERDQYLVSSSVMIGFRFNCCVGLMKVGVGEGAFSMSIMFPSGPNLKPIVNWESLAPNGTCNWSMEVCCFSGFVAVVEDRLMFRKENVSMRLLVFDPGFALFSTMTWRSLGGKGPPPAPPGVLIMALGGNATPGGGGPPIMGTLPPPPLRRNASVANPLITSEKL